MTHPSGDPVPAISEAAASGDIADLFDDIRATLGVPVVNLIWRHLAVFPGGLAWAWQSLKPLYASGTISAEATALRAGLEIPKLPGLSAPALAAAGLSRDDLARIAMIQASYERSNAMNMIALGALLAHLEGGHVEGERAEGPTVEGRPAASPSLDGEQVVAGEMPLLLTLDAMNGDLRALVEALNRIGGRDEILASMYRHLAHWPPYLALLHVLLAPCAADGRLEPLILGVISDGTRRAARIAPGLASPGQSLSAPLEAEVSNALRRFIQEPIGKMIAVVPLIQKAMPY